MTVSFVAKCAYLKSLIDAGMIPEIGGEYGEAHLRKIGYAHLNFGRHTRFSDGRTPVYDGPKPVFCKERGEVIHAGQWFGPLD